MFLRSSFFGIILSLIALSIMPHISLATANGSQPQTEVITVHGIISSDTTWTNDTIYRINSRVTVSRDATLTIQPGTIIKLNPNAELISNGTFIAVGTPEQPIVFTSIRDDRVGGDTDGDGDTSMPAPGDWNFLSFNLASTATIAHAEFRYGGSGAFDAMLYANAGTLTLDHVQISQSASTGLRSVRQTTLAITNTHFTQNAIQAALIDLSALVNWQLRANSCSANGQDVFRINGELAHSTALDHPGCVLLVGSRVTVGAEATLRLTPGTLMKFDRGAEMVNDGTFIAIGTPEQPISFTSIRDDSVGGDSNGDANTTQPAPGDWDYIQFSIGSTAQIAHAELRYGGGNTLPAGMLGAFDGSVTLDHVVVEHSARDGLHGSLQAAQVTNSTFRNNAGSAIHITDVADNGDVFVQNTTLTAAQEYGMRIVQGRVTLSCTTVSNNVAGGCWCATPTPQRSPWIASRSVTTRALR
jgi:hypothetical protein